ncbi:MAG TPA: chloride channel protein [Terriglobales bacterium]
MKLSPAELTTVAPGATTRRRVSSSALRTWFNEERFFLILAIFIGIFSGFAVVCFRIAIEWSRLIFLGSSLVPSKSRMLLAPSLLGLVVAALVILVFPKVRGSGVNQTKSALYIYDGYIPFRTAIGKFITSALAIGAGHSLGPEDPSLQIGAAIASALGRLLRVSRENLRLIAPVGAAAGLAAAFNAPISAVLFVIEEVVGRWSAGIFGAVVLSAVSSVVVSRFFLGSQPLFRIPPVQLISPAEILAYAALGIIGGIASVVFARLIGSLRPPLKRLPRWTQFLQPAVAGLLIGLIGYFGAPQVLGAGYDYIDQAIHDQFTWEMLGLLAGLKILATTLSFTSGTPGGMFAPTLFIGGMLGGAVGGFQHAFFPHLTGSTGTYALVGMGVLFAGFMRAPMTSVFMVLEVSGNYSIVIPVMVANTLSYLLARSLQPKPIFEVLTSQDGLELPSMEEQREEVLLRVEDAMRPLEAPVLLSSETVESALTRTAEVPADAVLLVDARPAGWSAVRKAELEKIASGSSSTEVMLLLNGTIPSLHPDQRLETALIDIADQPVLPVVHRAAPQNLVGTISLSDILDLYRKVGKETGAES